MREVGILEAKTNFSALVSEVEHGGQEVTITRHGRPVVKIVRAGDVRKRKLSGEELDRLFQEIRDRTVAKIPEAAVYDPVGVLRSIRDGDNED